MMTPAVGHNMVTPTVLLILFRRSRDVSLFVLAPRVVRGSKGGRSRIANQSNWMAALVPLFVVCRK